MALLPRGFGKGLLLGGLAAVVWGICGNRKRRATVAGPLVERAEGLPFLGPRLYSFFSGTMMREVYRSVAEDLLTQANSGELLDLEAGAGYLAVEVARRSRNITVTAMNRSAGMVQAAEASVYHAGLGRQVKVARGEAMDIPYPNEYFDYVVSLGGPQHWDAPELAMAEVYRVLKPGGIAWIYGLRRELPEEGWDRVRESLSQLMRPVFDMVVAGPASRALTEAELTSLASRTQFGKGDLSTLDVEIGLTRAPMLTRIVLQK